VGGYVRYLLLLKRNNSNIHGYTHPTRIKFFPKKHRKRIHVFQCSIRLILKRKSNTLLTRYLLDTQNVSNNVFHVFSPHHHSMYLPRFYIGDNRNFGNPSYNSVYISLVSLHYPTVFHSEKRLYGVCHPIQTHTILKVSFATPIQTSCVNPPTSKRGQEWQRK